MNPLGLTIATQSSRVWMRSDSSIRWYSGPRRRTMSYSSLVENAVRRSRASASMILSSETFSLFAYSAARASSEEEMSESVTLWPSLAISMAEMGDQTLLTGVGKA
jgi:hypothetical protein